MSKLTRFLIIICCTAIGGAAGSYFARVGKTGDWLANFLTDGNSSATNANQRQIGNAAQTRDSGHSNETGQGQARASQTQGEGASRSQSSSSTESSETQAKPETLFHARKEFKTRIVLPKSNVPLDKPPSKVFSLVNYPTTVGNLPAYLTPAPKDKTKKYPAIVWIIGGDCNTIGDVWTPQPRNNDQSAAAFREAGIVMMFPSLRGGNMNPGDREGLFGEVDDVIAAADYLAKLPYVDPTRIYLGGHSTGGTLALLTAETTTRFRATFSYGPSSDGINHRFFSTVDFNKFDEKEALLRTPSEWLSSIGSRVIVIEGQGGNAYDLDLMRKRAKNPMVTFVLVPGADHFNLLAPGNKAIAQAILKDTGSMPQFDLSASDFMPK